MSQRILIIEDRRDTAHDLRSILLRALGGNVDVANDGAAGLSLAQTKRPDVIVLDIDLPVLNGFEVLEQLKAKGIATRVIMLTGMYLDIDSAVKAIKAGACDYLTKPVDSQKLIDHIRKSLVSDSTINLRMISELPPLTRQLVQRLEAAAAGKTRYVTTAGPGSLPQVETSVSGFQQQLAKHWLVVLAAMITAAGGVMWAVVMTLYVGPRDFEIDRLRRAVEDSKRPAYEKMPVSPSPSADVRNAKLAPTSPTPTSSPPKS